MDFVHLTVFLRTLDVSSRVYFRYGGIFVTLVCESICKDLYTRERRYLSNVSSSVHFSKHSISIELYTFGPYVTRHSLASYQCPRPVVASFGKGRNFASLLHHRGCSLWRRICSHGEFDAKGDARRQRYGPRPRVQAAEGLAAEDFLVVSQADYSGFV